MDDILTEAEQWAVCYAQAMRECHFRNGARFRARLAALLAQARAAQA
jgi:hypothetical protein